MFGKFIKQSVSPELKKLGFKKAGLTWNRRREELFDVINIQKSRFTNNEVAKFTINYGVFFPEIWARCWGAEHGKLIKEEDCFPRFRLQSVSYGNKEQWWEVTNETNLVEIEQMFFLALRTQVLTGFEKFSSMTSVLSFYSGQVDSLLPIEKVYFALLALKLGENTLGLKVLNEVSHISRDWESRVSFVLSN